MYICSRQLWYSHISLNLLYFFFDISYFLWYFGFHFLISLSFSGTISCLRLRQKSIEFKSLAISSFSSVFLFILAVTVLSHYSCVYLFFFIFFFSSSCKEFLMGPLSWTNACSCQCWKQCYFSKLVFVIMSVHLILMKKTWC